MKPPYEILQTQYGDRLVAHAPLSDYTSARVGGPADLLLRVESCQELEAALRFVWGRDLEVLVIGGGSNILVSDGGFRGLAIVNRARKIRFDLGEIAASVWAESGANFGSLARQACQRGLSGLEWAVGIPGTVGGAVFGNAGAHGGDVAGSLMVAEILHQELNMNQENQFPVRKETWSTQQLAFEYRSSLLKRTPGRSVVLSAQFQLKPESSDRTTARSDQYTAYRHQTQPPGATMGSMFKNPVGDYAGRLIEAAGLKGARVGDAEISPLHANFFINHGGASASDVYQLIELARKKVWELFQVELEIEIELVGEWQFDVERNAQ